MGQRYLYQTIFGRLLMTFLIIIIPIYLLGFFMNRWGVQAIKSEIADSMSSQVVFYLEDIENEIRSMKMLQYDCIGDENINRLAILAEIMNLYESQQRMLQLQKRLVTIRNSSVYIDDVAAHIGPINKTISANNGIIDLNKDEYQHIRITEDVNGAQILFYKDNLYMTTLDARVGKNMSNSFSIVIKLDREKIIKKLSLLNKSQHSGVVLIYQFAKEDIIDETNNHVPLSTKTIVSNVDFTQELNTLTIASEKDKYYMAYATSEFLNMTLIKYMPDRIVMQPLRKIYVWFWVFTATSLLICFIYSIYTYKYIHEPLSKLVKAFKMIETGNMNVKINHSINDEFGYIYQRFNDMVYKINNLIDQVYKQKIMTQRAELKQLQSQINPHFLYNSFFLINMMARVQDENLIKFTKYLGEYFRFVTKSNVDTIALKDEVKHARVYTDIQKMRFAKRLEFNFQELPASYEMIQVPRLIIQPIIENSFQHAVEKKKEGKINVIFKVDKDILKIIVEDNGDEITDKDIECLNERMQWTEIDEELSGLINVNLRVRMMYGKESGIQVSRSALGGLRVALMILILAD